MHKLHVRLHRKIRVLGRRRTGHPEELHHTNLRQVEPLSLHVDHVRVTAGAWLCVLSIDGHVLGDGREVLERPTLLLAHGGHVPLQTLGCKSIARSRRMLARRGIVCGRFVSEFCRPRRNQSAKHPHALFALDERQELVHLDYTVVVVIQSRHEKVNCILSPIRRSVHRLQYLGKLALVDAVATVLVEDTKHLLAHFEFAMFAAGEKQASDFPGGLGVWARVAAGIRKVIAASLRNVEQC
mmetsp:Transcript_49255/g.137997  ORF Transcript_49255/g.137997 Transcript_49255/m.137997 type:complete len:240 (+) Transcript_49255:664-1383(+)